MGFLRRESNPLKVESQTSLWMKKRGMNVHGLGLHGQGWELLWVTSDVAEGFADMLVLLPVLIPAMSALSLQPAPVLIYTCNELFCLLN